MLCRLFQKLGFFVVSLFPISGFAEIESSLGLEIHAQHTHILKDNNKDNASWQTIDSSANKSLDYGTNALLPDTSVHFTLEQSQSTQEEFTHSSRVKLALRQAGEVRVSYDSSVEGEIWQVSGAFERDVALSNAATPLEVQREAWVQALVLRNNVYLKIGSDQYLDSFIQGYTSSQKASIGANSFGFYSLQSTQEAIFPSLEFGLKTADFEASYNSIDSRFLEDNREGLSKLVQTNLRGASFAYDNRATSSLFDYLSGHALKYFYQQDRFAVAFEHYSLKASQQTAEKLDDIEHRGNYANKKFWGLGSKFRASDAIESFANVNYFETDVGEALNQAASLGIYSQHLQVMNLNLGSIFAVNNYKLLVALTHTEAESSLRQTQNPQLKSTIDFEGQTFEVAYFRKLNKNTHLEFGVFSSNGQRHNSGLSDSRYSGLSLLMSYQSNGNL